jgi:hypothetical protein
MAPLKTLLSTAALTLLFLLGTTAQAAAATTPCWKQVINDWYDGRIDKAYPVSCYRQAIKNLPPDVETYSSAPDDLERALQNAMRQNGGRMPALIPPSDEGRSIDGGGGLGSGGGGSPPDDEHGVLDAFEPANADSIPVPLLVLAGVAMLLLAAAGTGFVAKRIQERRVPVAPVAPGPGDGPAPPQPPE